ncbi:hypothetical protein [Orrella dioscoreae]|uniref:Uncharacterized protein n=2 Tax=root TaxID=1 RepID=A0A1C3K3B6_9BURK|nr:hypothetical protein [Orrella dioscoreae]SBT25980.1 hypothetical protein ODI_01788 [Orrella dioscoreae]SOE50860.1 hypothetical protein ODI_R3023 [Orrella dioscoreae]
MPPDLDKTPGLLESLPPGMRSAGKALVLNTVAGAGAASLPTASAQTHLAGLPTHDGPMVWGLTLTQLVAALTALYFVLQIGLLCIRYSQELPKLWRRLRGKREGEEA